jgi:hypothetical protein
MINKRNICVAFVLVVGAVTVGLNVRQWNWQQNTIPQVARNNITSDSSYRQAQFEKRNTNTTERKHNNNIRSQTHRKLEDRDDHENEEDRGEHDNDEPGKERCDFTIAPTATPSSRKWRRGSSNNSNSSGARTAKIIAPILFLGLIIWFCYHNFLEKVQQGEYDNAVKSAKQDLLSSDTIVDDENIVVYDTGIPHPTNGQYCAVYLEPQPLECGQTDIEQKYKINLKFDRDIHQDDESYCTVDGWSISGEGYDTSGDQIVVESGFVTMTGKACWTEKRKSSTVLCNGRFNFDRSTFSGAWLSRNGNGGEFIRFYHHNKSIYKDVDMDSYAYKGPTVYDKKKTNIETDDPTEATSDDSYTVIDVSDASDERDRLDETRIIDVTYPQHRISGRQFVSPLTQPPPSPTKKQVTFKPSESEGKEQPLLSSNSKTKNEEQEIEQVVVPVDVTKYQQYEPPTNTSASPELPIWVTEVGRLRPIDEESTLVSVPITLVMTTSCEDSTCSGLSTSGSSFQRGVPT